MILSQELPSVATTRKIAGRLPELGVPAVLSSDVSRQMLADVETVVQSAHLALSAMRTGVKPSEALNLVVPIAATAVFRTLITLGWIASLERSREPNQTFPDGLLHRKLSELGKAVLADVEYALEAFEASAQIAVKPSTAVVPVPDGFMERSIGRQVRVVVGVEVLLEMTLEDAFSGELAAEIARNGREHFDDARRSLRIESKPAFAVHGTPSDPRAKPTERAALTFKPLFD